MVTATTSDAPETQAAPATDIAATSAPTSDAANQTADAAASSTQDEAETSVQAFLGKSKEGKGEDGKEAAGGEAGKADDVDPLIKDAQEKAAKATEERVARETSERIEREAAEEREAQRKAALKTAFDNRYAERMANAGTKLEARLVEAGINAALAHEIAQENATDFNSHHADGLQLYEPEAKRAADAGLTGRINDTLREVLGHDTDKFFGTGEDPKRYDLKGHYEALKAIWTDGMKSAAEAEAETSLALVRYHRQLQSEGRLNGSKSTQSTNGSSSSGGASYRTRTEARNLHARGEIGNAEMRRINADPSIPEI